MTRMKKLMIKNGIFRGYHQANTKLTTVVPYLHYYNLLCGIKGARSRYFRQFQH